MAKRKKASIPATRDLEDFAIAIAIVGGLSSQLPALFPAGDTEPSPAQLLWLCGPALVAAAIITRGAWWPKVGLSFVLRRAGIWSLAAMGLPIVLGGVLVLASESMGVAGVRKLPYSALADYAAPIAGMILFKNLLEEFYFRGFLTGRFEDTRFSGLLGHLLTGVLWAMWHLPYWLVFLAREKVESFGGMPLSYFVALGFVSLPLQSIFYGELRLVTGSILPPVLFHWVTNLLTLSLLESGIVTPSGVGGVLLSPGSHGILYTVILAALGLALMHARKGKLIWDSPEKRAPAESPGSAQKPRNPDAPVASSAKSRKESHRDSPQTVTQKSSD